MCWTRLTNYSSEQNVHNFEVNVFSHLVALLSQPTKKQLDPREICFDRRFLEEPITLDSTRPSNTYSISQEICTRFLLCCALLWLYNDWFSHIHQAYFIGTVASNDCPSASKATLMNMDKYFMWIHYERLHNHNKAKHNKTVCIFLGICCNTYVSVN